MPDEFPDRGPEGRVRPDPAAPAVTAGDARASVSDVSGSPADDVAGAAIAGRRAARPDGARCGGGRVRHALAALAMPVADVAGLALGALAALAAGGLPGGRLPLPAVAGYAAAVLAALALAGLHRTRISLRAADQAGRIAVAALLPAVALLAAAAVAGAALPPAAAALAVASALGVLGARVIACAGLRAARRRGLLADPTLIIGSGTFGAHLAGLIREHPELGLRVAGFLDEGRARRDLAEPTLGQPQDLPRIVAELGIRRVLVTFGDGRDEDLVPVLRACRRLDADVCVVPRLYELGLGVPRASLDEIWGIPLVPLRRGLRRGGRAAKRAFDITVASVLLVAAAPVLLALGAVIRLRTGQPAVFRQLRVTGQGREATILKLRTVTEPPPENGPDVPAQRRWTVDPAQCRPLGRWLRATHLDELPQLLNVLRGDMSLVGPRPERGCFAAGFARDIPRYADRDRMAAGLTGWAQVHGLHGDTSIVARSRFDNQYIEYWSPWLDLVILARTVRAALAGMGAGR